MKLNDRDVYLLPEAGVFIKRLNAVVFADLHLGYEGILAESGVFVPKVQLKEIIDKISSAQEKTGASKLILLGDVKHEFSDTTYHEYKDLFDFFRWAVDEFSEVILIKGNHDNFIARVSKRFDIEPLESYEEGNFFFTHGHKDIELPGEKLSFIGHEHPSVAFFLSGEKIKIKAFLISDNLVVLPALSPLMPGTEVNFVPKSSLLSPLLRKRNIDSFEVYGIFEDEVKPLGKLGALRRFSEEEL